LISRWRLNCSAEMAWNLLTNLENWPQWWPQVKHVRLLHRAPIGQTGTHVAMTWRSMLGYGFTIDVVNTRRERSSDGHCEIEGRSEGDLLGRGLWVLEPASAREVDVTYRYEVELNKPWMRALAPVLRAVFAWNHFAVMRSGARGMAAHLQCDSSNVANWTAGPTWA
jgi:hypothetical protein